MQRVLLLSGLIGAAALAAAPAEAASVFRFNTGSPDGLLGALSQPANDSHFQTETADDFILSSQTRLTGASFTGLLPTGTKASDIKDVEIEFYHVFPGDSKQPPSGNVTTRTNSPGDVEIAGATRDANAGSLSFSTRLDASNFRVGNTVTNVHGKPEFTGGDGPATGDEVSFNIDFIDPVLLDADHFFFRPEVELDNGSFLWLSTGFPVSPPGTPFSPDRQAWIRNDALAPDWVRLGADVTHQGPFNMSFALEGVAGVPEPASWALMIGGCGLAGAALRRQRRTLTGASAG